ncbi:hypothetical protein Q7A53_09160 [Halobacillus rhizosphaerae]|uniref:hypothetical protein n=1 Tax=Halobacillus rhizosphaerae TaxID=3064889 RepID=UPI00398B96F2
MDLPAIQTNIWDAVIAIPIIISLTEIIKIFLKIPKFAVPSIALILGLTLSVGYSHRGDLAAGIFMGWFYGYAAVGSYASMKSNWLKLRGDRNRYIE